MHADIEKILIPSDAIQSKVQEMGAQLRDDYAAGGDLLLVGVLKGCIMFMVDLARAIEMPLAIDFIAISSYGHSTESSGVVRLLKDLDTDIAGRHVLIPARATAQAQPRQPQDLRAAQQAGAPHRRCRRGLPWLRHPERVRGWLRPGLWRALS
jgi:hypoxanthine phosphoribosyltransferase